MPRATGPERTPTAPDRLPGRRTARRMPRQLVQQRAPDVGGRQGVVKASDADIDFLAQALGGGHGDPSQQFGGIGQDGGFIEQVDAHAGRALGADPGIKQRPLVGTQQLDQSGTVHGGS